MHYLTAGRAQRSYLFVCALFGFAFGVRYTIEVWAIEQVTPDFADKYLLVALTFVGMLAGEILGARISDRLHRAVPIKLSALCLGLWSGFAVIGFHLADIRILLAGAVLFGAALGAYHSALDSWFDDAMVRTTGRKASDAQLTAGFFAYNTTYLVASVVAFPSLAMFQLDMGFDDLGSTSHPIFLPYLSVAVTAVLIALVKLEVAPPPTELGRSALTKTVTAAVSDAWAIITSGRLGLLAAIVIGSLVNFLVQYIDHFAPADLLGGLTVRDRAFNLAILNAVVLVAIAALLFFVESKGVYERLTQYQRLGVLNRAVFAALAFVVIGYTARGGEGYVSALALGCAQALFLAVLPLFKVWVLSYAIDGLGATALSILGVTKRVVAITATLALYGVAPASDSIMEGADAEFLILLGLTLLCGSVVFGTARYVQQRQTIDNEIR